jgi:hypothetical protein
MVNGLANQDMIYMHLLFILVIQQCSCSLSGFNQHRRTDYLKYHDLPEDCLIEHLHPNTQGNAYVLGNDQFTMQRPLWRRGAVSFKPQSASVAELNELAELILDSANYGRVPLRPLMQALWKVWPQVANDIPSAKKRADMQLEELVSGDWQWRDE